MKMLEVLCRQYARRQGNRARVNNPLKVIKGKGHRFTISFIEEKDGDVVLSDKKGAICKLSDLPQGKGEQYLMQYLVTQMTHS